VSRGTIGRVRIVSARVAARHSGLPSAAVAILLIVVAVREGTRRTGAGGRGGWCVRCSHLRVLASHRLARHAADPPLGVREAVVRRQDSLPMEGFALPGAHPVRRWVTSAAASARPVSPSSRSGNVVPAVRFLSRKRRSRFDRRLTGSRSGQRPKRQNRDRSRPGFPRPWTARDSRGWSVAQTRQSVGGRRTRARSGPRVERRGRMRVPGRRDDSRCVPRAREWPGAAEEEEVC